MKIHKIYLPIKYTIMGFAVFMVSTNSFAQTSQGAVSQSTTAAIDEVTVTARRVAENLQDVPVAISAFTGEVLERRQITSTDDLGKITPNLEFTNNAPLAGNNASSQVFIRGIGQVDPSSNVDPGVGLYIDDVYIGRSVGGTMELRDIANIQVLRGPQGTLFGRNTIGGAVLLTTNQPGDEFKSSVRAGLGSDSLWELFLATDMPVSDNFKTRFTIGTKRQDGYVTRVNDGTDLGDTDNWTATAKFLFTPSDNLQLKVSLDYTEVDENGVPLVFAAARDDSPFGARASALAGCPGATFPPPSIPQNIDDPRCFNEFQNKGKYRNNGTNPLESSLENWGLSLHIQYDYSDLLTFKSITSYRELKWRGIRDADNTPLAILHTDYSSDGEQMSQEFQALYATDRLTGVVGLYYFEEDISDILTVTLGIRDSLDSDNNDFENDNWAIFTQWDYDFSENLSGTAGVRYTKENKGSIPDQFNYATPDVKYLEKKLYEQEYSATTISTSVNYRWNDRVMTYASYSEGFKGGGFNSHFNGPASAEALRNFFEFDEETAKTVEVGFKSDLLDDRLRLNGAIFRTDYEDLQFIFRVGVAPYLLNAGEAEIQGAELELTWAPNESWLIEAGLGILDDSIESISTDFLALGAVTAVTTDNTLPYTPDIQANLGIGYYFDMNNMQFAPRIDISYRDETFFDTSNTKEIAQLDTVTTVDASLSIDPHNSDWRLVLGINNATDEDYPIAGNSSLTTGSGYAEIAYARPRWYFATLTYDF